VPFNIAHGVDDKNRLHLPEGGVSAACFWIARHLI
jgi:hypothetical protein